MADEQKSKRAKQDTITTITTSAVLEINKIVAKLQTIADDAEDETPIQVPTYARISTLLDELQSVATDMDGEIRKLTKFD